MITFKNFRNEHLPPFHKQQSNVKIPMLSHFVTRVSRMRRHAMFPVRHQRSSYLEGLVRKWVVRVVTCGSVVKPDDRKRGFSCDRGMSRDAGAITRGFMASVKQSTNIRLFQYGRKRRLQRFFTIEIFHFKNIMFAHIYISASIS